MVNITMLCANRPRLLKQALDSIGDIEPGNSVYIRDAGMNKEVGSIAEDWALSRQSVARYFKATEPLGTGPARNYAIDASQFHFGRGDYLYLSDDDVYFTRPDWLEVLIEAYEATRSLGYRVLGAYNHPFNQPVQWVKYVRAGEGGGAIPVGTDIKITDVSYLTGFVYEVYAVATQSMLMDWATWDEFGPFCQTPAGKVCQSEDVDFCNRIRAKGYKVGVISPALLVNTGITNSFGDKIPGWEMVKSKAPQGVIVE